VDVLMNKIEVVLGVTVLLLSVLSMLFINFGVVPSLEFPGHYTYSTLAYESYGSLLLISVVGVVIIVYGVCEKRVLESGLGFVISLCGFLAFSWVNLSLIDGTSPYIKSFPTSIIETLLPIIPNIFLGIALMLDGIRQKMLPSNKRT
jgi:hypothetical protein